MDDGISDKHAGWIWKFGNVLALPGPAEFWP
jgi:hypothetical protein